MLFVLYTGFHSYPVYQFSLPTPTPLFGFYPFPDSVFELKGVVERWRYTLALHRAKTWEKGFNGVGFGVTANTSNKTIWRLGSSLSQTSHRSPIAPLISSGRTIFTPDSERANVARLKGTVRRKGGKPLSMQLPYEGALEKESGIDSQEASSLRILFLNLSILATAVNGHKWRKALWQAGPYRRKPLMFSGEFTKQTKCTEEENGGPSR